jgi:peptidoglycan/xylan/chitin deacetylase (PgdA/CDA1 family)
MFSNPGHSPDAAAKKATVVTTSWDDGDRTDLKLAELLASRGLPGTFYISTGRLGSSSAMSATDLRGLATAGFEVGAHTVTHPVLTDLHPSGVAREVVDSKRSLEAILGREVTSFAYPKGRYDAQVVAQVKEAGYRCARGSRMLATSYNFAPFEMAVTVQAYPHPWTSYAKNLLRRSGRLDEVVSRNLAFEKLGRAREDAV